MLIQIPRYIESCQFKTPKATAIVEIKFSELLVMFICMNRLQILLCFSIVGKLYKVSNCVYIEKFSRTAELQSLMFLSFKLYARSFYKNLCEYFGGCLSTAQGVSEPFYYTRIYIFACHSEVYYLSASLNFTGYTRKYQTK